MAEPPKQDQQQQCPQYIPYSGTYTCPSYCQSDTPHCSPEPEQAYIQNMITGPDPYDNRPQCMTKEELAATNKSLLSDCESESYVPPKKASKNCTCDCNNFIESETGYRQATKCVCAPYKSSHIHFVT